MDASASGVSVKGKQTWKQYGKAIWELDLRGRELGLTPNLGVGGGAQQERLWGNSIAGG